MEAQNKEAIGSQNQFGDFSSKKVNTLPFEHLAIGWHRVIAKTAQFTNDFMSGLRNPTMKTADKLPAWKDPTYQLAIYFEGENHKGATRRFTKYGYEKYDELLKTDPELAAECIPLGEARYAVDKVDMVRMVSEDLTNKAEAILNRCLTAMGVPEGTGGNDLIPAIHGKELMIQIGQRTHKGKDYLDVINFASVETPEAELSRIPHPENVVTELPATAGN